MASTLRLRYTLTGRCRSASFGLLQRLVGHPESIQSNLRPQNIHTYCRRPTIFSSTSRPGVHIPSSDLLLWRHGYVMCGVFTSRFKSSVTDNSQVPAEELVQTATQNSSLPAGYIPDPPPIPEALEVKQQVLNALGEPTLASLDLAHWTPAGLVQMALENLHVGLGMPWWGAIVTGTIVLRLCMFPLVIKAQKNAAQMHNHMPTITRLQEKFTKSRMSGNPMEASQSANELMDYMNRNEVRPMRNMLVPMAQLPVFVSVFVGVRQMANLPVDSMKTGGLFWFTDLTIPDPLWALPFTTMATFLATIELGVDGVKAGSMSHTVKWVMRIMPVFIFPFIINFPAAMLCYWFTSNAFSLVQVLFLKIPGVRDFFGIPLLVKHDPAMMPKKKKFMEGFQETMKNSKLMAQIEDRERMNAVRFREAGTGPIQKTYRYDPTKVKSKQAISAKSKS